MPNCDLFAGLDVAIAASSLSFPSVMYTHLSSNSDEREEVFEDLTGFWCLKSAPRERSGRGTCCHVPGF
jgi:hypothetical protein